jgi:hypothetical protein|tara:strand:+ start:489 stop:1748 length:1260 start_codon:yes stop_codon:yes gene_type:complete
MFWLIENNKQFEVLKNSGFKEAFVEVISNNPYQHPSQNSIIGFYVRPIQGHKGYILPTSHPECENIFEDEIYLWLKGLETIYVRDKKEFLHYTILKQLVDITLGSPPYILPQTTAHSTLYRRFPDLLTVNQLVPITKHYEVCEQVYDDLEHRVNTAVNPFYNDRAALVFNAIERNGIKIDKNEFEKHFHPVEDEYVYTAYNYKTLTTRPSNKFGGVNYAALSHKDGSRKSFIPRNNRFVEFDIGAYHPTLAAMLVDYEFGDKDIHKSFAEMYKVDYAKAKELTFKQLYGGVFDNYKDLPFFKATSEYIRTTWETFQTEGVITCPISHYEYKNDVLEDMNPQKLFNYILQNMETSLNIEILFRIFTLLKGMNTKLVLYTYDSFLLDVDDSELDVLEQIKKVFYKLKLQIKEKNGINYDFA